MGSSKYYINNREKINKKRREKNRLKTIYGKTVIKKRCLICNNYFNTTIRYGFKIYCSIKCRRKGNNAPWAKHCSAERKIKIGLANKGRKHPQWQIDFLRRINTGRKHSKETIEKRSSKLRGLKWSEEKKKLFSEKRKGIIFSKEHIKNIGLASKKIWNTPEKKEYARLRRALQNNNYRNTSIELKIRDILTSLGLTFEYNKPILNIEHKYNCDIFLNKYNLIIECDGVYWHNLPKQKTMDNYRNKEIICSYNLLRLGENYIKTINTEVLKKILLEFKGHKYGKLQIYN